jgi:phenylpyruvate tautomerase PptA (4-oxalocrotonate tautomerase family)
LVADGVEVVIEPSRAGLSPEQVRALVRGITEVYAQVTAPPPSAHKGRKP